MTEQLLEALRMGFDVSIKYRNVDGCYVVTVSRNNCHYSQVINGELWYVKDRFTLIEDLINIYIRYGTIRVGQQEEEKRYENVWRRLY